VVACIAAKHMLTLNCTEKDMVWADRLCCRKSCAKVTMNRLDELPLSASNSSSLGFPTASRSLETFGFKFSSGGAHISRTMMLAELRAVLDDVPKGSSTANYREAILGRNVLGKTTDSTRQKSLRHLRELYALDETTPIFGLLRKLHASGVVRVKSKWFCLTYFAPLERSFGIKIIAPTLSS
jgi:hypothetical protein